MVDEDQIDLSGDSGFLSPPGDDKPAHKPKHQISAIGESEEGAETRWTRRPAATARGACHTKTFTAKLRGDAIEVMDEAINQWLEDNPDYEVKFISTSVGEMTSKTTEKTLFISVWV